MKKLLTFAASLITLFIGCSSPVPLPDEMFGTYTQHQTGYTNTGIPALDNSYMESRSTVIVKRDSIDSKIVSFEKLDVVYDAASGTTGRFRGTGRAIFENKESWLPTDTVYMFRIESITGDIPENYVKSLFKVWNSTRTKTLWTLDFDRSETWYKE